MFCIEFLSLTLSLLACTFAYNTDTHQVNPFCALPESEGYLTALAAVEGSVSGVKSKVRSH
jgi:hypothetical protein